MATEGSPSCADGDDSAKVSSHFVPQISYWNPAVEVQDGAVFAATALEPDALVLEEVSLDPLT